MFSYNPTKRRIKAIPVTGYNSNTAISSIKAIAYIGLLAAMAFK
jgi:hypothetical protein